MKRLCFWLFALSFSLVFNTQNGNEKHYEVDAENVFVKYHENADPTDLAIAGYLQQNCKDREQAVLYIRRNQKLISVTETSSIDGVSRNYDLIEEIFKKENDVVEAHCHLIDLDQIKNGIAADMERNFNDNLQKFGKYKTRQTFWAEMPSGSDAYNTMIIDLIMYHYHKNGNIQHRIVILEPGSLAHVISYGLKGDPQKKLREVAVKSQFYDWEIHNQEVFDFVTETSFHQYEQIITNIHEIRCNPFVPVEQNLNCLIKPVAIGIETANQQSTFFVHDRGFLNNSANLN